MVRIKLAILCFLFDHYNATQATTKLTANEFYCYKIEALQFFTFTWFNFEPSSQHLHLFHEFFRFTVFNGQFTDHAKPLPDPE